MNEKIEAFGPREQNIETILGSINKAITDGKEGAGEIRMKLEQPVSFETAEKIRQHYKNAGWGEVSIYDINNPEVVLKRDRASLPGLPDDVQNFYDK